MRMITAYIHGNSTAHKHGSIQTSHINRLHACNQHRLLDDHVRITHLQKREKPFEQFVSLKSNFLEAAAARTPQ
jgi:hypothetical protein